VKDGRGEAKRSKRRSERGEKGELIRRRSATHLRTFQDQGHPPPSLHRSF